MGLYLDASVILPTLVEEASSQVVEQFIRTTSDQIVISAFAAAEVTSAISRLVRTGQLERQDTFIRLNDFDAWQAAATEPVDLQASDIRLAHNYVRRFELMLRVPDAIHIAICRRLDLTLVTLDQRMALAATELGVPARMIG